MKPRKTKELWKEFPLGYRSKKRYAVSSFGRIKSFENDIRKGKILRGGTISGYRVFNYSTRVNNKKVYKHLLIHQLVAALFLPGKPEGKAFVLHLDHNRGNNHIGNLKWASRKELTAHSNTSPLVISAQKSLFGKSSLRSRATHYLYNNSLRKKKNSLTKILPGEVWKEIKIDGDVMFRYGISSFGRIMSFIEKFEDGWVLKPRTTKGYKLFCIKLKQKNKVINRHYFIRRLVAEYFLPPPSPGQEFVILLDRNRSNNHVNNLKWATRQEMIEHFRTSPHFINARLNKKKRGWGRKLNASKVQFIKQKIFDPNRRTRLKILARQFGVTTMTLQRIKTGENWGHVYIKQKDKNGKVITISSKPAHSEEFR